MTEKRFTFADGFKIVAVRDNGEIMNSVKVVDILNTLNDENEQLKEQLKSIEDGFEFSCTRNHTEFDKDKLIVKDTHTKIHLDGRNLFIEVYIPQTDEFYRFKYTITGKSLMREFIENYNPKGDVE